MAGVLSFSDYLGGPDNVQLEQVFPGDRKILQYDFPNSITNWTFKVEAQTIVVNPLTFDRDGTPNFSTSNVVGYFAKQQIADTAISTSTYVQVISAAAGITIPADLYQGKILPDARQNVPITVVTVTWTGVADVGTFTPAPITSHRWAFMQCWNSNVTAGDPTLEDTYNPIVVGSSV
jgi:hypothetical protein